LDLVEALKGRRSVRAFKPDAVPFEALEECLEAAIWAPSGGNAQTWRFVVARDENVIKKICLVSPGIVGSPPPVIVAVCSDKRTAFELGGELGRDVMSAMDAAMAAQNMLLRAYDQGLGTCVVKSFSPQAIQRLLDIPEHVVPELLVCVGYPASVPRAPRRKPLREVAHLGRYGVVWE